MRINIDVIKSFLDVELLNFTKKYTEVDSKLTVKFSNNKPLKFIDVKSIIDLLTHLDRFTKYANLDSIIKTSIQVNDIEVTFDIWVDDINIDPFFHGNKNNIDYIDMMKNIKKLIIE